MKCLIWLEMVLLRMDPAGGGPRYWVHWLYARTEGAKWVTTDPNLATQINDLAREEIIPLDHGGTFPNIGRPFLTFDALSAEQITSLRRSVEVTASVHGVVPAEVAGATSASAASVP